MRTRTLFPALLAAALATGGLTLVSATAAGAGGGSMPIRRESFPSCGRRWRW
ncbi:hypothetical protein AB0P40_35690 [Streptomyces sp. NPDC079189]|uniref:hypothetical protein n=1 Tax=Streptomyces sp. NPDC079189 TaxID=3154514 RepID=UPI00342EB49F